MKFIIVFFVCAVILTATAYPQSRSNNKLKNKPKSSRQELPPATPTPVLDKTTVSQNTSQVLTIASNSTPSVIASTESPKAAGADASSVAPPSSVVTTVTTVAPAKSSTVAPKNATTTAKPDEEDEDDEDSSEEEEDADVDSDVEEGDFEEGPPGPPGPPGPGPEGDLDYEDEDEDEDRAADQSTSSDEVVVPKPTKKNKKGSNSNANQEAKIRETSGGIDAYVPGYVTDQGEVLVPIDTLERGLQYTIISDRFVSIPQKKSHLQRNPVYLYRQDASAVKPSSQPEVEESSEEEPAPEVFAVKETETSVIFATKPPPTNETQKEEQISGNTSQSSESQEDEDDQSTGSVKTTVETQPLGVVPATRPTGEDDEEELGTRRSDNRVFRRNFYHPSRHFAYSPQFDYMNNLHDNRRLDYPTVNDAYSANFYRSYGRMEPNRRYSGPYGDVSYEDSLEDFGRSDFEDY